MSNVSIIIPTHNRPHLLAQTVESAWAAGKDVEVIVVDDASSDSTAEVCRSLRGIKYIRLDRNQGVAGARNIGILASSTPQIAFLDDDDLRIPGSLDVQLDLLASNPDAGFACGAMLMADQNRIPTGEVVHPNHQGGDVFWELLELEFPVMPISVVIRKECFYRVGLLKPRLNGIDDWDLFVRIAELYPVVVTNEPVAIYRKPNPLSDQGSSSRARQLSRAARHLPSLLRFPRAMEASAYRRKIAQTRALNRISDVLLLDAAAGIDNGSPRSVASNIFAAAAANPFGIARPNAVRKAVRRMLSRSGNNAVSDAKPV